MVIRWSPSSPASEIFQDFAPLVASDLVIFEDWDSGGVDADALWNIAFESANSLRKDQWRKRPDGSVGTSVQRSSWVIGTHSRWCSLTISSRRALCQMKRRNPMRQMTGRRRPLSPNEKTTKVRIDKRSIKLQEHSHWRSRP